MRHLKAFHVFHVAANSSSYTEAADKLNLTHGAVSKQIKTLEEYLSQSLFFKSGRNVLLTKHGETLARYTSAAFMELERGVETLTKTQQYLEVSCEPTLTMRWLMSRITEFNEQHKTDVRLSTSGGPVTLGSTTGLSLAIRRDDFEIDPNYVKIPLVEEWVGLVCSPDYWQQVNGSLQQAKLLHSQTRPDAWRDWMRISGQSLFQGNQSQTFGHFYFCLQAAVDGLGMAIGSYPLIVDDLKRGNLIAPFGFVLSGYNYVLISQDKLVDELEIAFLTWLGANMHQCIPKPEGND